MYETSGDIIVRQNTRANEFILQEVECTRMPAVEDGVLAFTFTVQALVNLRSPHIGVQDFIMQRLLMAGFPVIEPVERVAVDCHYEFNRSKAGILSRIESYIPAQIRYEWRPA